MVGDKPGAEKSAFWLLREARPLGRANNPAPLLDVGALFATFAFMAADSKGSVVAALAGNSVIMVAKFVGFFLTGSGAMFAEAIHTLADVCNQALLLLGIVRSEKEATDKFQYGYGQERFVWALISAVGIFFLGCGVTLTHGIESLFTEHEMMDARTIQIALVILVGSLIVEGYVLWVAFRNLLKAANGAPFAQYLREEADPAAVAVLLEDFAACLGVILAICAIGLTSLTGEAYWDSVGSILIALLLGAMAVWLALRNKELLVGSAVPERDAQRIRDAVTKDDTVEHIAQLKTRMIDTETYDVLVELDFRGDKLAAAHKDALEERFARGFESFDDFYAHQEKFADDIVHELGVRIDELESKIKEAVPKVKHIDVELD